VRANWREDAEYELIYQEAETQAAAFFRAHH